MRADQMICPNCGHIATCESVDVGVSLYLKGDFRCSNCPWELDGPEDFGFLNIDDIPTLPIEAYSDVNNR